MSTLHNLFHKLKKDRTLSNSLYDSNTTMITKQNKDIVSEENLQINIYYKY